MPKALHIRTLDILCCGFTHCGCFVHVRRGMGMDSTMRAVHPIIKNRVDSRRQVSSLFKKATPLEGSLPVVLLKLVLNLALYPAVLPSASVEK